MVARGIKIVMVIKPSKSDEERVVVKEEVLCVQETMEKQEGPRQ